MQYNGKELVEYKSDTPQFWPEGKEMLVWYERDTSPRVRKILLYHPLANGPFVSMQDGCYSIWVHAAEIPTTTKRRVKRVECAGMAVKNRDGEWTPFFTSWVTEKEWNEPMPERYIDRALTLADALEGRTLGMEVEE